MLEVINVTVMSPEPEWCRVGGVKPHGKTPNTVVFFHLTTEARWRIFSFSPPALFLGKYILMSSRLGRYIISSLKVVVSALLLRT